MTMSSSQYKKTKMLQKVKTCNNKQHGEFSQQRIYSNHLSTKPGRKA